MFLETADCINIKWYQLFIVIVMKRISFSNVFILESNPWHNFSVQAHACFISHLLLFYPPFAGQGVAALPLSRIPMWISDWATTSLSDWPSTRLSLAAPFRTGPMWSSSAHAACWGKRTEDASYTIWMCAEREATSSRLTPRSNTTSFPTDCRWPTRTVCTSSGQVGVGENFMKDNKFIYFISIARFKHSQQWSSRWWRPDWRCWGRSWRSVNIQRCIFFVSI